MDRMPAAAAGGKEGSSVEIGWTDEKHATYLHSLEVSFVTRVFRSSDADQFQYYHLNGYDYHHQPLDHHLNGYDYHHQPLDRHLPDSCDSTLDSTTLDLNHAKQYRWFVDTDDRNQLPAPGAFGWVPVAGGLILSFPQRSSLKRIFALKQG